MKRRTLLQTAATLAAIPAGNSLAATDEEAKPINIVFDGPPGPVSGRFVEVETDDGAGIRVGEWIKRPDGLWALRITNLPGLRVPDIASARRALIQAFVDDPDFRETYQANIACCLMDEQASQGTYTQFDDYDTRMAYAERIMQQLFNPRELIDGAV